MSTLAIRHLTASVADRQILNGIDLTVNSGEVHAVMGPNGAGKSTLSAVLMGKSGYTVLGGEVTLDGADLLALPTWQRAQAGLHLVMQYPTEVPGVSIEAALREAGAGPWHHHLDPPSSSPGGRGGADRLWRRPVGPLVERRPVRR
ncbi:MAG: ATP-binding cassette domain-containing protein [Ilumatobacteraceae bacterium]